MLILVHKIYLSRSNKKWDAPVFEFVGFRYRSTQPTNFGRSRSFARRSKKR
jgi:hypothetical protein